MCTFSNKEVPKGYCKKCWDDGVGKRRHRTEDCDDQKRLLAIAKKAKRLLDREAKEATKNGQPAHNKKGWKNPFEVAPPNRKWRLGEYAMEHCKWCKAEDVDPNSCRHDPKACFRRPDGPMKGPREANLQKHATRKRKD